MTLTLIEALKAYRLAAIELRAAEARRDEAQRASHLAYQEANSAVKRMDLASEELLKLAQSESVDNSPDE
jgi:hypothetical protein